jgi:SAM-dependent methyltransferase
MRIDYDRMAEIFDDTRSQSKDLLDSVVLGVSSIASRGERVLDIGCGTGRFLLPLSEAGIEGHGIDISSGMLRRARAKGLVDLVRGDAAALPFADRAFKASLVTNVLHLVPDWRGLMSEACRVSARAVISFDIRRDEKDPIKAFKRVMDEVGLVRPAAGPLESELAEECAPECRIDLGSYEERKGRGEVLSALEKMTYTFQSDLTKDQNRLCMDEFARSFAGDVLAWVNSVSMIVWDPAKLSEDLRGLLSATRMREPFR